eukprot:5937184-Amphidinium_carterae.1
MADVGTLHRARMWVSLWYVFLSLTARQEPLPWAVLKPMFGAACSLVWSFCTPASFSPLANKNVHAQTPKSHSALCRLPQLHSIPCQLKMSLKQSRQQHRPVCANLVPMKPLGSP